jgi:hypothetical protein
MERSTGRALRPPFGPTSHAAVGAPRHRRGAMTPVTPRFPRVRPPAEGAAEVGAGAVRRRRQTRRR